METTHRLIPGDARTLHDLRDASVHFVVTSPPYPMIEMWDEGFASQADDIRRALAAEDGWTAFRAMHRELDRVWGEVARVLVPGGIACINIGDATRTLAGEFRMYPNHSRITMAMVDLGLSVLPDILWRKPTNAPNKFMGSGMLPPGAYVTYEHESILVFRKGDKRPFTSPAAKAIRRRSAYFWEERNAWFSDVWMELRGVRQPLSDPEARSRSGAYPFELPFRLIQMFSVEGDTVLDPFAGTGTTLAAAAASARNSIGIEREPALAPVIAETLALAPEAGLDRQRARIEAHLEFVATRTAAGKPPGYTSEHYGFPVMTNQEVGLILPAVKDFEPNGSHAWRATHQPFSPTAAAGTDATRRASPGGRTPNPASATAPVELPFDE